MSILRALLGKEEIKPSITNWFVNPKSDLVITISNNGNVDKTNLNKYQFLDSVKELEGRGINSLFVEIEL